MEDKNFIVTIEKDNDGTFIAYNVDESPYTLIGRGATVKEAKADFANSVQEVKASEVERNGAAAPILWPTLCLTLIFLRCLIIIRC